MRETFVEIRRNAEGSLSAFLMERSPNAAKFDDEQLTSVGPFPTLVEMVDSGALGLLVVQAKYVP